MTSQDTTARDVLDFWFGPPGADGAMVARDAWFRKDANFDREIRERFSPAIEAALAGGLRTWEASTEGALARILLLDQFTRNAFRDTPRAFAGDVQALAAARMLVDSGADRRLSPMQRWFVYMPFEHAEDLQTQHESVRLFTELSQASPGFESALDYAVRHREVIQRFGRFPHRNAILGRASNAEEQAFLAQPGSSF